MSDPIYPMDELQSIRIRLKHALTSINTAVICQGDDPCVEDCLDDAQTTVSHLSDHLWNITRDVCPECKAEGFESGKDMSITEDCFRCSGMGFVNRSTLVPGYVRYCRECKMDAADIADEPCPPHLDATCPHWVEWDLCSACYAEICKEDQAND